ncbi:MAG TPA: rhomboid family intramembrane serine protease [bacterium]|nr:rhomboid family intramembrane serine protease [bacterium]
MPGKNKTEYDWVELVVKAGQLLGLNPVRTRWKLRAWQDRVKARKAAVAGKAAAITREHKICPRCHALNPGDGKVCIKCKSRLHSRPVEMADRFLRHFSLGMSPETFIAAAMIAGYVITVARGSGSSVLSASARDLIWLGGLQPAAVLAGQWWRLWTCAFLHGGLIHIGFNAYALVYVMPFVREVYGGAKALFVFFITGIAAGLASLGWALYRYGAFPQYLGLRVSIGASGAISGLIGLLLVWGHRDGTAAGISIRNNMARWVLYTAGFGFFIGADNAAHAGGWIAGGLLALLIPTNLTVREGRAWNALGVLSAIAIAAAVAIIAYLAFGTPAPPVPAGP